MNISKFFIDRPIFAGVLSTLIFLAGLLSLPALPISEGHGLRCPRCRAENRNTARFCAQCGLALEPGLPPEEAAGRTRHPQPLPPPAGFQACEGAEHLHYRWESEWGGPVVLGTESLVVYLFNGGYDLESVVVRVIGLDEFDRQAFGVQCEAAVLHRGQEVRLEVPSYDVPRPARTVRVTLLTAQFSST